MISTWIAVVVIVYLMIVCTWITVVVLELLSFEASGTVSGVTSPRNGPTASPASRLAVNALKRVLR